MTNVLDWKKLKQFVKGRKPVEVSAGILNDWFWTGATVYKNGKYKRKHNAWIHSYWATPGFKATMKNGDVIEVVACKKATKKELKHIQLKHNEKMRKIRMISKKLEKGTKTK